MPIPKPNRAPPGVVAAMLEAYRNGFFPMADPEAGPGADLVWFNPDPRGIIPLDESEGLHIPRRLRQRARSGRFVITADEAFGRVIRRCAAPRATERTSWIDRRIVSIYTALHEAGHAHSLEGWLPAVPPARRRVLVGGLYGVRIGGAFFAESKFSRPELGGTDASKVCLYHLIAHLRRRGFVLLDVQFWNPHLDQFGCTEVPRLRYLSLLAAAVERPVSWMPFAPDPGR